VATEAGISPVHGIEAPIPELRRFDRHRGPVTCVAGIPGRAAAVSSGYDSALGIVDFGANAMELLGYHRHLVNRVVVNAAGTLAASCSSDYTACLWDLQKRKPLRVLRGHWDDVEDFAFVDDTTGISVSRDRRIFIWNLESGAIVRVLEGHDRDVLSVEYANGRIYTSGDDMTLRQWDLASGALLRTWGPFEVETDTCAIDPLHNRVVLGDDDGNIRIFDCDSGEAIARIEAHRSGIKKIAVSPANGDLLSAAYDQRILIWNAESLELRVELEPHPGTWERSLNWSPDGASVLAGSFDGSVLSWDAVSGVRRGEVPSGMQHSGNACFNDVSCSENGLCASVSDDGYVRLARVSSKACAWLDQAVPRGRRLLMNAVHLSSAMPGQPFDSLIWAGAHDQVLHVFESTDGRIGAETTLALDEGPINCIRTLAPAAGKQLAFVACYSGAVVRVVRGDDGSLAVDKRLRLHGGAVKAVRINPRGRQGISGAADGSLLSWDLDGRIVHRLAGHTAIVDDVDFDPDGRWLASVSRDFTVKVYESSSGRMLHSILLGRQSPKCVLFWDGNTVIVGNYWGALWRVDLSDGRVTAHPIARNGISSLSRCGIALAASSYDGSICLVDPGSMTVLNRIHGMQQKVAGFESRASFDPVPGT